MDVDQPIMSGHRSTHIRMRNGLAKLPLLAAIGAGVAVSVFAGIFTLIATSGGPAPADYVNLALRKICAEESALASDLVATLKPEKIRDDATRSKLFLVHGYLVWQEVQDDQNYTRAYEKALQALDAIEHSRDLGFPKGYDGLGQFLLGMALAYTHQYEKAAEPLVAAIRSWAPGRIEAMAALVDAELHQTPPDLEQAQRYLNQWQQMPGLTAEDIARSRVLEIELMGQKKALDAVGELAQLIPTDSEWHVAGKLAEGAAYLKQADSLGKPQSESLKERAANIFRAVASSPNATIDQRQQAAWLAAFTDYQLGNASEALSALSRIRTSSPYSPEAAVSGIIELDVLVDMHRIADAVATSQHVTMHLGHPEAHENPWLPTTKMRQLIVNAGRKMLDQGAFADAVRFAESMPTICTESDVARLRAEAYRAWGDAIQLQPSTLPSNPPDEIERLVRRNVFANKSDPYFQIAGQYFEKLANREMRSDEFLDLLWQAIECYQEARALQASNAVLHRYLELESRPNRPRGIVQLADNYLSLGQLDQAIIKLNHCLQTYDNHPMSFAARETLARVYAEQLEFEKATELLLENLYDRMLTPDSPVWRSSLFDLGSLLVRQGDILQLKANELKDDPARAQDHMKQLENSYVHMVRGLQRLEEGLRRYPNDPRKLQTLYSVAQGYRLASQWPTAQLELDSLSHEDRRKQQSAERRQLMEASLNAFQNLKTACIELQNEMDENEASRALLRNGYFGEADLRFQLKDYNGAIGVYRNAANRFHARPESLEAYAQIALCQSLLGNQEASRRTIEQATQILTRIPPERDPQFAKVTRYDRQQWSNYFSQQIR